MPNYAASAKDIPQYTHVNANGSLTSVKGTDAILVGVTINTKGASSNTLTLKDGNNNTIAVIDTTSQVNPLNFGNLCPNGLQYQMATGTAADVTIIWA